jgi:hypothetical protein
VGAVSRVSELSRNACREDFEKRFTVGVMVDNCERAYLSLIAARTAKRGSKTGAHRHTISLGVDNAEPGITAMAGLPAKSTEASAKFLVCGLMLSF